MQRRGRLVEDRSRRGVDVMAASGASPRLALLRSLVSREFGSAAALVAHGMDTVLRVPIAPQPFKARRIIGELGHEFHQRKLGIRGLGALRFVSIYGRHGSIRP